LAKTLIWTEVSSQLKQANNQRGSRQKSASEKKKSGNKVPRDTSKPPPTKQKQKPAAQQKQKQREGQRQRGNKDADPTNAFDSGKKQRSRSATPRGKPNGNPNRKKSQS
jgi:hypothetical protein